MEFYHGTTLSSARGIIENGFRPRGGAVWFTNQWGYAKNRAEQKVRRKNGRPIVIKTHLEVDELRTARSEPCGQTQCQKAAPELI